MKIKSITLTNVKNAKGQDIEPTIELKNINKHNIPVNNEDQESVLEAACIYIERTIGGNTDYADIAQIDYE